MGIVETLVSKDGILVIEVEEMCFGFLRGNGPLQPLTSSGSDRSLLV